MIYKLVKANSVAFAIIAFGLLPLVGQDISVKGAVRDSSGKPVVGALVKIRNEDLGQSFLVVTEEGGRYHSPRLFPGLYTVQAYGDHTQTAVVTKRGLSRGSQQNLDLVVDAPVQIPPREKRMTDSDYEKLLPEGPGKNVVVSWCVTCHTLRPIVAARKTREKWMETLDRMYNDVLGHDRPLTWTVKYDVFYKLNRPELMIDYLAKNFGPENPFDPGVLGSVSHPDRNLPGILLKGAAANYVGMEFSLPSGTMPSDVAVDAKGIAWVSESNTGMIGRFDVASLSYTRIPSPPATHSRSQLNAIAVDPAGHIWCVDDGPNARILEYDPTKKEFNTYAIPPYQNPVPEIGWARIAELRFSDGEVWGTGLTAQRILKLDKGSRVVTEYSVPLGSAPFGLAVVPNMQIWYAAEIGNVVVNLDPNTGRLTPHDVPTARSDLKGMAADAEGNLWVAATESNKLVKVESHTGNVTEFPIATDASGPYSVDLDTQRDLVWFSERFRDKIGRFDPRSKSFVDFPLLSADLDLRRVEVDRSNSNRIWWSGTRSNKVGYIEVFAQK